MLITVLRVLIAMPQIVAALKELVKLLNNNFGTNWPKEISNIRQTITKLNNSKSSDERINAAKELYKFLQKV